MSKIVPVPLTIPMAGLVCWHDLYDPTQSLASVSDLSGNGYSLQLGSTSGADTNDPAWATGGKGLVHTTDDYCLTGNLSGVSMADDWTVLLCLLPDGTTGTVCGIANAGSDTEYQRVISSGGYLRVGSRHGTEVLDTSPGLAVSKTVPGLYEWSSRDGTICLKHVATGTSTTVANQSPTGTPRVGLGCIGRATQTLLADAITFYEALLYSRALSTAEINRAYRVLKGTWAARGVTIS